MTRYAGCPCQISYVMSVHTICGPAVAFLHWLCSLCCGGAFIFECLRASITRIWMSKMPCQVTDWKVSLLTFCEFFPWRVLSCMEHQCPFQTFPCLRVLGNSLRAGLTMLYKQIRIP